ncbi:Na+/H+ antiporter subunit E [Verrucomicrobiales bacterium]|nr:Na+/H+ antiporter subunit E [Verrucomicrobiales bacterium]MDC0049099.1 Na+/H+ antiporter subunit E [Verrucomicrobiota bacterium]
MYRALIFSLLLITWVILSGLLDAFHISLGILSCALVTWLSSGLLFNDRSLSFYSRLRQVSRLPLYLSWLLWQIVLANIHVLRISFSPRVKEQIQPQLVRFRSGLKSDFENYVLAQSITLTPGTVTLQIDGDVFLVHAISDVAAKGLMGSMVDRVRHVFSVDE